MKKNYDYAELRRSLTFVTAFGESASLYLFPPENRLFVVRREDRSAREVYDALQKITADDPRLATVFSVADEGDHIVILQDYISGISLRELLEQAGPLPPDEARRIALEVCEGLCTLHKSGIIHRDITPNNVILSSGGGAVVIDYGIARAYEEGRATDTVVLGTPGYAAPEQFGFSQSDARTDVYALGVLLNVMLTGELPGIRKATGSLGKIVSRCIEIDSKKRYDSMEALLLALRELAADGPADKVIRQIPGLRSKNAAVVVLAFLGYLLAGLLTVAMLATASPGTFLPTLLSWVFLFPIPFICFHDLFGIWNRLPFTKGSSKRSQRIIYIALGILSILIGLILFASINVTK